MQQKPFLIGAVGTGLTALCCFTPILVVAFSAIGAAALVAYLDLVLFPLLGFFAVVTVYGLLTRSRAAKVPPVPEETPP